MKSEEDLELLEFNFKSTKKIQKDFFGSSSYKSAKYGCPKCGVKDVKHQNGHTSYVCGYSKNGHGFETPCINSSFPQWDESTNISMRHQITEMRIDANLKKRDMMQG